MTHYSTFWTRAFYLFLNVHNAISLPNSCYIVTDSNPVPRVGLGMPARCADIGPFLLSPLLNDPGEGRVYLYFLESAVTTHDCFWSKWAPVCSFIAGEWLKMASYFQLTEMTGSVRSAFPLEAILFLSSLTAMFHMVMWLRILLADKRKFPLVTCHIFRRKPSQKRTQENCNSIKTKIITGLETFVSSNVTCKFLKWIPKHKFHWQNNVKIVKHIKLYHT